VFNSVFWLFAPTNTFLIRTQQEITGKKSNCRYNYRQLNIFWRFDMCEACGCSEAKEANTDQTFEEKVKDTIESIRGALQSHGGDVELVGIDDDNTVKVRLQGACQGCPGAAMTMKQGIERILKEKVPEVKEVIAVD
jgi:Fe-S cluster biogenesis protein NfuA